MSDKCFESLHYDANEKLFGFARELRKISTPVEKRLWKYLRNGKLDGLKFRRQHPIMSFVVDFYCHEKKLVIECDGSVHEGKFNEDYDEMRTNAMNEAGITVLRFRNDLIMNELDRVQNQHRKQIRNQ